MWFWLFMFAVNLLIPVTMLVCGRWMWKHTPTTINSICGYRTKRSMQNKDTWQFAHHYCGRLWWKLGWILLIPSIFVQFPFVNSTSQSIGILALFLVTMQMVIMVLTMIPTELALKRTFAPDGTRK